MKKVVCFILVFTLLMIIGSSVFAVTVDSNTYKEPQRLVDEDVAKSGINTTNKTGDSQEIIKEDVPKAPLPKTGGIPAETFYVAGALIIVAALILSRKKTASSKR